MRKAYDYLDRSQCIEIMRGYGMVQNTARLIDHHWDSLIFPPKAKRSPGKAFITGRGVKQGDPTSPMIFDIVVDAVVRAVLEVVWGQQEARHNASTLC